MQFQDFGRLPSHLIRHATKFMTWMEIYILQWVTRNKYGLKREPFEEVLRRNLIKRGLNVDNMFQALRQHKAAISGSILHECLFGKEYLKSDVDVYVMSQLRGTIPYHATTRQHLMQSINPDIEWCGVIQGQEYHAANVVTCRKYAFGRKTRPKKARRYDGTLTSDEIEPVRCVECITVDPRKAGSLAIFFDRYVDISFTKVYFFFPAGAARGVLRMRHRYQLMQMEFRMNWDLTRYTQGSWDPENKVKVSPAEILHRLWERKKKYIERGATCLNPIPDHPSSIEVLTQVIPMGLNSQVLIDKRKRRQARGGEY